MADLKLIRSIFTEYGMAWVINRSLYSAKLKILSFIPAAQRLFEKKTQYPKRLDLFDIDVKELKSFISALEPADKEDIISTADKACTGVIRAFSWLDLDYGDPIDWQLNPLSKKKCDRNVKWFKIPDFDKDRGDIKIIWEASRFSHFITLARAYLLTGDKKYYEAFSKQLEAWLNENEYGCGANFKCGQECSLRIANVLLAYTVFNGCGMTNGGDSDHVKEMIDRCYRKILSNFFYAYRCIKNNHTVSELMGMIIGAWCCEDGKRLKKAFRILDKVIDRQFTEDGGYVQFSFNYQRLALQDIELLLSIEKKTGHSISGTVKSKVKNAAYLMYQCMDDTGDMPNYGPNDGALVFPVTSCGYRRFDPVVNTVYALTNGFQPFDNGKHQEELIWFSGGKNLSGYPHKPVKKVSSAFADAGLYTIRRNRIWSMTVLNDYRSRPAHMDQLHFDLWVDGINVFCDSGSYSYASDLGQILAKNISHNTASVERADQMLTHGPFMIYNRTKRKNVRADVSSFEGTVESKNGYTHCRKIEYSDDECIITDILSEDGSILFHTPCDVRPVNKNEAEIALNDRCICRLLCDEEIAIGKSKQSLFYFKECDINCLAVKAEGEKHIKTKIIIINNKTKESKK